MRGSTREPAAACRLVTPVASAKADDCGPHAGAFVVWERTRQTTGETKV